MPISYLSNCFFKRKSTRWWTAMVIVSQVIRAISCKVHWVESNRLNWSAAHVHCTWYTRLTALLYWHWKASAIICTIYYYPWHRSVFRSYIARICCLLHIPVVQPVIHHKNRFIIHLFHEDNLKVKHVIDFVEIGNLRSWKMMKKMEKEKRIWAEKTWIETKLNY